MEFTLDFKFFLIATVFLREGNGNPLQCSCLENPRDGAAWWAAIYGITQSQTRLKWLSSSMKKKAKGTIFKIVTSVLYFLLLHVSQRGRVLLS